MHTGKIRRLARERGFGFIDATDGREIFFHSTSLEGSQWESLQEGTDVEFEVEKTPKGPKANNVRIRVPS